MCGRGAKGEFEIPLSQLPTYVQDVVSAGTPLGSLADATTRVETLRTSAMDCRDQAAQGVPCGQNPVIVPSPTTSGTATTSGGLPTDTATLPGAGTALPVTPNVSITTRQTP